MRIVIALALSMIAVASLAASSDETPEQIKARADAARSGECSRICLDYAKQAVELSNRAFTAGEVVNGHKLMKEAVDYADRSAKDAAAARKRQKDTEIGLRKLANRMRDIKNSLNFEDREPVEKQIETIERLRSDVLTSMFGQPKKTLEVSK